MNKPSFFIVGAAKSGTTALATHLNNQKGVSISNPKETHFFDYNFKKGESQYLNSAFRDVSQNEISGDATPHYLFLPYVPKRIHSLYPNAKIIIILRNPVDRAYADWWMYYSRGRDNFSFEKAISLNLARLSNGPSFIGSNSEKMWAEYYRQSCGEGEITHRPYIEMGYYADQIANYLEFFDEENIKIILFDDFVTNTKSTICEVAKFLSLNQDIEYIPEKVDKNIKYTYLARPLFKAFRLLQTEDIIHSLPIKLKKPIKRILTNHQNTTMSCDMKNLLITHYENHIRKLESNIQRDLANWLN